MDDMGWNGGRLNGTGTAFADESKNNFDWDVRDWNIFQLSNFLTYNRYDSMTIAQKRKELKCIFI